MLAAHLHQGQGPHGIGIVGRGGAHTALPVGQQVFVQRGVDHLLVGRPDAGHQGQVGLAGFALAELVLQLGQRRALLGHQQDARGLAVQAVHQLQELGLGPRLAQLLDHTEAHTRAAMHGHAGRLVQGDQVVIFKQDGKLARRRRTLGLFLHPVGNAHRRHAHHIPSFHSGIGVAAPLVDAHFAAADDAVDMGLGHAFQVAHQKVIQALAGTIFVHRNQPYSGSCGVLGRFWGLFALYNVFHLRVI